MNKTTKILLIAGIALVVCAVAVIGIVLGATPKYDITFEVNGGDAVQSITAEEGQTVALPTPTKTNCEFGGWYTTADFSGEAVTEVVAAQDQTFYAKWINTYAVNLELDGGTLSAGELRLKQGESLYALLSAYTPTKPGVTFGAWFINGSELTQNSLMPANDITAEARYQVAYTVELWVQSIDGSTYEKQDEVITKSDYVGVEITSVQRIEGFTEITHENTVTELTLSDDASKNVFRHYYDRRDCIVQFMPVYPDGTEGDIVEFNVKYGATIKALRDYYFEGFCLVGWSTELNGEILYTADYIGSALYGGSGEDNSEVFTAESTVLLYPVWKAGYVDMFGYDDYLHLLDEQSDTVYLERGGVFFAADYNPETRKFTFKNVDGKIILKGVLKENGTFIYESPERAEFEAYGVVEGNIDESVMIYFDVLNGIRYTAEGKTSEGTYYVDETGEYVATFTEGPKAGEEMRFMLSSTTYNGNRVNIFQFRNEAEVALGKLVRFAIYNGNLTYYLTYDITLDGYGIASFNTEIEEPVYSYYLYTYDAAIGVLTLADINTLSTQAVMKVFEVNGKMGYALYNEANAGEFTNGDSKLTLDGGMSATYFDGTNTYKGYYSMTSSYLGGTIVSFIGEEPNVAFTFYAKVEKVEVPSVDAENNPTTETVTNYTFETRPAGYKEYYYQDASGAYYTPMLVLNETVEGRASVYGYTALKTHVKISEGKYTFDETTNKYTYEADTFYTTDLELVGEINVAEVKTFTFQLTTMTSGNTMYTVSYWFNYETEEEEVDLRKTITNENGDTLTIIAATVTIVTNGSTISGTYTAMSNTSNIIVTTEDGKTLYVEVNEDSFVILEYAPVGAYFMNEDGTQNKYKAISLDGKGGATYLYLELDAEGSPIVGEDGNAVQVDVAGTVTILEKTSLTGAPVYLFEADDESTSFEFVLLYASSNAYACLFNEEYNGVYAAANGDELSLDGYGYNAIYTTGREVITLVYYINGEQIIGIDEDGKYYYFDISERSFSLRGEEMGSYLKMDNQGMDGYIFTLDGYDKLTVSVMETNEAGESELNEVATGTYTFGGEEYTLTYTLDSTTHTLVGVLSVYAVSDSLAYNVFIVKHAEAVNTYVITDDQSVLILDQWGGAVKYSKTGVKEEGTYMIITDTMLYYVNDASSDACIYRYNVEEGTAVQKTFGAKGYFTKELESLVFSKYGFAIFNGETRYYYDIVNGKYIIYRQGTVGEEMNAYGFVEEDFGYASEMTKEYNGKIYYESEGTALKFNRAEETKDDYPVLYSEEVGKLPITQITFSPSGSAEFTVICYVTINNRQLEGTITREVDEEGKASMYILLAGYRFDIVVNYSGMDEYGNDKSTYEVVGLSYINDLYSNTYLTYYYIYAMFGMQLPNSFGYISMVKEYDKTGEETRSYINASFGANSGMYDTNGNLFTLKEVPYTVDEELGVWVAEFADANNYKYTMYFGATNNQYLRMPGYVLYAVVRHETIVTADGVYELDMQRIIASDYSTPGSLYSVMLKKNGEEMAYDIILQMDSEYYYVVRERDENGVITSTRYFKISLVEEKPELGEETTEQKPGLTLIESAVIAEVAVNTLYNADGTTFADITEDGVILLVIGEDIFIGIGNEYNEETATYTVTVHTGATYTVQVVEGKIVVAEVVEQEPSEEEPSEEQAA
ncbi:MAG: InlB B-repeat-containing protein [Clostridia bacterium]|nr:InlB B-repeat-containing protein [Clostridia bacterium]